MISDAHGSEMNSGIRIALTTDPQNDLATSVETSVIEEGI
jgi:hypothetical protein